MILRVKEECQGTGLVGSEQRFNISSYSTSDQALIRTNQRLIQEKRQEIISTVGAVDRKAAFDVANALTETNKIIHGQNNNTSQSWKDIGYFDNINR